ncbi:hypothetical protein [Massilia sp. 9I]|uniref:hypothetical protein n=1 Tax=Massilia sp. 9I TaxID=2653152 RepID=UPI0012F1EAA6|nr:hypothetical protein [Massilia sp. 9I]VXB63052.1 conserved hypothetical protein [Massilia sp. 9I]
MDELTKADMIATGWKLHGQIEEQLLRHPATRGSDAWPDKQRLLLADMAIHLLQTALKPGDIELDKLRNSLHAILTISDQFLPQAGLKQARAKIYSEMSVPGSGKDLTAITGR